MMYVCHDAGANMYNTHTHTTRAKLLRDKVTINLQDEEFDIACHYSVSTLITDYTAYWAMCHDALALSIYEFGNHHHANA